VPYLSTSAVVIHHEEALYQLYAPFTFTFKASTREENGEFAIAVGPATRTTGVLTDRVG